MTVRYEFRMCEYDDDAPFINDVGEVLATNIVTVEFEANNDITHNEITERFFDFLKGCGYCFELNDTIRLVRADEE